MYKFSFMVRHHHAKFEYRCLSGSEDTVWTFPRHTEIFVYFYLATLPTYLCSSAEYCCWSSWSFIADDFSCSCMAFSSPCVIHTDCSALCRSCSRVVTLSASAVRAVSADASSCCRRLISLGSVETRLRVSWEHNVKKNQQKKWSKKKHDQKNSNKKQGWEECLF